MKDLFTINARKHDDSIHRSWQATLLEHSGDLLVFEGVFEFQVDHKEIGIIRPGTVSREYYWLSRCFNVFRFNEPAGELKCFYCNVNLPPVLNQEALDYIDLDLDVIWSPGTAPRVLDQEEFKENAQLYGYSAQTIEIAKSSIEEILRMIEDSEFPFNL